MPNRHLPVDEAKDRIPAGPGVCHDAAAVLTCDGEVVVGIEEERLSRVKHSNRFPEHAIRACLQVAGIHASDVDKFAYYSREDGLDRMIAIHNLFARCPDPVWTARDYFARLLGEALDCDVPADRVEFVNHHRAHAMSAYVMSRYTDALVVTLDGAGDMLSGTVSVGSGGELAVQREISVQDSLGRLYDLVIRFLGYGPFDEYKVMGLAPYGNARRFRRAFEEICSLQPEGRFSIAMDKAATQLRREVPQPRRPGEPFTDVHRDLAAALQEALERAVFHLLEHYRTETGLRHLCLAGGVAHNSTMNGRIARSGLFDGVFVQPAAHDAGCAYGAALWVHRTLAPETPTTAPEHVYWGRHIGNDEQIGAELLSWTSLVDFERVADITQEVARLLADGAVVGWMQGRAEFGPRALGNRSILADPRPAANKDRINQLVKERESYRPFAPAVQEEHAHEYFDMPAAARLDFMTFTVPVRESMRERLGAITHVDGSARVQTVSRARNPRFWELLEAFRARTGTGVLLNTSFNHSVEPIVDTVHDGITCLLTTKLAYLVIGDYVVTKRAQIADALLDLVPALPEHVRLSHTRCRDRQGRLVDAFTCDSTGNPYKTVALSSELHDVLSRMDGSQTMRDLLRASSRPESRAIVGELEQLWATRFLSLGPAAVATAVPRMHAQAS